MQKGTDQRPLDFFSFDTQNQYAYLKVYYIASINRLNIDNNSTKKALLQEKPLQKQSSRGVL